MDRIVLEINEKGARQIALDKLASDMRVIADEGAEQSELARSALEHIAKMSEANKNGAIDEIRKNYTSLDKIRQADMGLIKQTTEFLRQSELGSKMLDTAGKILEAGKTPIIATPEPRFRSAGAEFVGEVVDMARSTSLSVVQIAGSVAMWAQVIDNVRNSKSDAELAIALGRTLIDNTFFGMVLNSAYAGIVHGDNDALGKAVMYMLVPETALPALVEALGTSAINIGAQSVFESQMEALYKATTWDAKGVIKDFGGLGKDGPSGSREFVDAMADGFPDLVAQDMVNRAKASDTGIALNLGKIRAVGKAIKSTVQNGNVLVFKEDGPLMNAGAVIRKINADITDLGKALGVRDAAMAQHVGDLPGGLHQSETRAFTKLYEARDKQREVARKALAEAIVRTFEVRNRAEGSLDQGKAKAEYEALLKLFEELAITKEGSAALDAEGAPYNLISNWLTSTRDKQVAAVKAVQKFKDAYSAIAQMRDRAESLARTALGDAYTPDPRPLTGSLPLTGSPELDVRLAQTYLGDVSKVGASCIKDLELIKKATLQGAYDEATLNKLFDIRFKYVYWSSRMQAASDAQSLHWASEILDKQALYKKHTEAAAKVSALQKEDGALQQEFRDHYTLSGEFIVGLSGPKEIASGDEAKLVCSVQVKRPGAKQAEALPADILAQYRFIWKSGKAVLGEYATPQRAYRLDTVGEHNFSVQVKRPLLKGTQEIFETLGQGEWTVKVVADSGFIVSIEGAAQTQPKTPVPLTASVKTAKPPLPTLKYAWSAEGKSLGDKATASFVADNPGTYVVTLNVQAQDGKTWRNLGDKQHRIVVAQGTPDKDGAKTPPGDAKSLAEAKYTWLQDSLVYLETLKEYDRKTFATFKAGVTSAMVRQFVGAHPKPYDDRAKLPENCADITSDVMLQADCFAAKKAGCGSTVGEARTRMNAYGADCSATINAGCQVVRTVLTTRTINGKEVKVEEPVTNCDEICGKARACDRMFTVYSGREGYAYDVQGYVNDNYQRCLGDAAANNGRNQKALAKKIELLPESLPFKRWQEYKSFNDWTGYLTAVDKVKQEFNLPEPIPSPPVLPWTYGSSCGGGSGAAPPTQGTGELNVTLAGPAGGASLKLGEPQTLNAGVSGGKPPYTYTWSGASGSGAKATTKPAWAGDWTVLVKVADADGKTGEASATLRVQPLALKLTGAKGKVYYGRTYTLNAEGLEPVPAPKPEPKPDPCAGKPRTNNPFDECNTIVVDPDKAVSVAPPSDLPPPPIPVDTGVANRSTQTGTGGAGAAGGSGKYRYIWQADPAVSFNTPTTDKPTTKVTYDRMGQVKLWCEAHTFVEGAWHTIGECDQVSVEVIAPTFTFTFAPPTGQGRIGQEVRAVLSTKPEVAAKYLDYRWFEPASSNRMEYTQNASDIGFKVKDAKPITLKVLARVPHYGDTIADLTSTYTGVAYDVQIGAPRLNGPQLQVWVCDTQFGRAQQCGMKDIPQGQFVTFQDIYMKALVTPAAESPRYRWTVAPSGSCGLPGAGSELHLNCSTTGTYNVNLEVADADGNSLGKAESSVSVSVRMEQTKPGKAPDTGADDKVRQAKQQLDLGKLDQAIELITQAVNLDPKHAEAGSLRNRWLNERQQVTQHLSDTRQAMEQGDLDKAAAALANAKRLHPRYQPVIDAERDLDARKQARDTQDKRIGQLADSARQQIRAGQYESALTALNELRGLDAAKAGTLAKELATAARQAASSAEQKRDFQQSGRLFAVAKLADPSDIEAARGVNNAPVYEQRMKEVRAWQGDARDALERGDFDTSGRRIYDIKNWESTLPGPLDKVTVELENRHNKEFAAYQKTMDDLRNRGEKAMLNSRCDEARTLVNEVSARRPVDQERKWIDMMNRELSARAGRGECAGKGNTQGTGTQGVTTGGAIRVSDGENSLSMDQGSVEPGKLFNVRFTASPRISKYSYVPMVSSTAPHGPSAAINAVRLTSQDITGKADNTLSYWAPTTPGKYDLRFIEGSSQKEILSLTFEVRKGAATVGATAGVADTSSGNCAPANLTRADITARTWRFSRSDGKVIAEGVRLTEAGRMQGYYHQNEDNWVQDNGVLVFRNPAYQTVTRFTGCASQDGRLTLSGTFLPDKRIQHLLTEVARDTAPNGNASGVPVQDGRDYTSPDIGTGKTVETPAPPPPVGAGYVRIEACVDGSDWLRIDNGRLVHEHRAFSQIGTHPGCPATHLVAGGGLLVNGRKVGLSQLPWPVGIASLGRYEVELARGTTRLDGKKGLLLDDEGPGGPSVYAVRLYPGAGGGASPPTTPVKPAVSFDNGNIGGVGNGPRQPTIFTLNEPRILALIQDYHWNDARGKSPGSIGLRDAQGRSYGPWGAQGSPGQGGVPNAYWTARPMVALPAGTYTVIDSDPASWAQNSQSGYRGFTRVETLPLGADDAGGRDYTSQPIQGDPAGAFGVPKHSTKALFEIGNVGGVENNPSKASKFDLDGAHVITLIQTYHWNNGRGAMPGSIALRCRDKQTYGPWPATGSPGQGGVANAYWTVRPNVAIPATTCAIVDSDPATWAHNAGSGYRGFARVEGYAQGGAAVTSQSTSPVDPALGKLDSGLQKVDDTMNKLNKILDLFK